MGLNIITNERLLMLDSGAFTVWTKGKTVDLDDYIRFCLDHPDVSYYVNLDVIPGKPNQPRSITKEVVADACKQSWRNYMRMVRVLPEEKVLPVYHRDDSIEWLEKYLDFGMPYMCIAPMAMGRTTNQKIQWMNSLKGYLLDSAGKPVVKTHGLAVTSIAVMKAFPWHSVDSATPSRVAAYGMILVPLLRNGVLCYANEPFRVAVSMESNRTGIRNRLNVFSPKVKRDVLCYLDSIGIEFGEHEGTNGDLRILKVGVSNTLSERHLANVAYMRELQKILHTKIYFAGTLLSEAVERKVSTRLISYAHIGSKENRIFNLHLEMIRQCE